MKPSRTTFAAVQSGQNLVSAALHGDAAVAVARHVVVLGQEGGSFSDSVVVVLRITTTVHLLEAVDSQGREVRFAPRIIVSATGGNCS